MIRRATVLAALLVTLGAAPAHADDPPIYDPPTYSGYATPTVCVTDTLRGQGWRVGHAIRVWNAAQRHVRLTPNCAPGMGVLRVTAYSAVDDRGGYATWENNVDWLVGRNGAWFHTVVDVRLNNYYRTQYASWQPKAEVRCWSQMATMHEFAHALGLGHTHAPDSVTNAEAQMGRCGAIGVSDLVLLHTIYAARTRLPHVAQP